MNQFVISISTVAVLGIGLVLIWMGCQAWKPAIRHKDIRVGLPILYCLIIAGVLVTATILLQPDLLMESTRHLLGVHIFLLILLVILLARSWDSLRTPSSKIILLICLTIFLGWFAEGARKWTLFSREDGKGYAAKRYRESPLIRDIRQLANVTVVYSNLTYPLEVYTDKKILDLPARTYGAGTILSNDFTAQMKDLKDDLADNAAVALFEHGDDWVGYISLEDIQTLMPLQVLYRESDGILVKKAAS